MPLPNPILIQKPFSLAHMRSAFAHSDPKGLAAMTPLMPWDYYYFKDEFDKTLDTAYWTTAVSAGGGPTAFAVNNQRNGAIQGATGVTDDDVTAITFARVIFDPADKPLFWLRWIAPAAVTGFSFEIGFSDAKTAEELPGVTDVDADPPTVGNGVTDIACVHMDTDQAVATARLVADGTTGASQGLTLVNRAGTAWTPTASGIIDVIVGVEANLSRCWIWDSLAPVGIMQALSQGPDSAILVRPYALFRTRNTTSKTITLLKAVIVAEENRTT